MYFSRRGADLVPPDENAKVSPKGNRWHTEVFYETNMSFFPLDYLMKTISSNSTTLVTETTSAVQFRIPFPY